MDGVPIVRVPAPFAAQIGADAALKRELSLSELCYLPATDALELFKTRQLSPVELLAAQIQQVERLNSRVTAVVMDYFQEAMLQARHAEQAYVDGTARPLEGVTIAVKDEHNIAGRRMTSVCRRYR